MSSMHTFISCFEQMSANLNLSLYPSTLPRASLVYKLESDNISIEINEETLLRNNNNTAKVWEQCSIHY